LQSIRKTALLAHLIKKYDATKIQNLLKKLNPDIISKYTDPNYKYSIKQTYSLAELAIKHDSTEMLATLQKLNAVPFQLENGETTLHYALNEGSHACARKLITNFNADNIKRKQIVDIWKTVINDQYNISKTENGITFSLMLQYIPFMQEIDFAYIKQLTHLSNKNSLCAWLFLRLKSYQLMITMPQYANKINYGNPHAKLLKHLGNYLKHQYGDGLSLTIQVHENLLKDYCDNTIWQDIPLDVKLYVPTYCVTFFWFGESALKYLEELMFAGANPSAKFKGHPAIPYKEIFDPYADFDFKNNPEVICAFTLHIVKRNVDKLSMAAQNYFKILSTRSKIHELSNKRNQSKETKQEIATKQEFLSVIADRSFEITLVNEGLTLLDKNTTLLAEASEISNNSTFFARYITDNLQVFLNRYYPETKMNIGQTTTLEDNEAELLSLYRMLRFYRTPPITDILTHDILWQRIELSAKYLKLINETYDVFFQRPDFLNDTRKVINIFLNSSFVYHSRQEEIEIKQLLEKHINPTEIDLHIRHINHVINEAERQTFTYEEESLPNQMSSIKDPDKKPDYTKHMQPQINLSNHSDFTPTVLKVTLSTEQSVNILKHAKCLYEIYSTDETTDKQYYANYFNMLVNKIEWINRIPSANENNNNNLLKEIKKTCNDAQKIADKVQTKQQYQQQQRFSNNSQLLFNANNAKANSRVKEDEESAIELEDLDVHGLRPDQSGANKKKTKTYNPRQDYYNEIYDDPLAFEFIGGF